MIYEKDKKGNYKNKNLVNAFEFFAKSEQGIKFLSQFAKEGQTIAGHKYTKNGKFHNAKIDINYQDDRALTKDGRSGETSGSNSNGRNKVNVELSTGANDNRRDADGETVAHESFIHARRLANDYYDDGKQNYSTGYDADLKKHAKTTNTFSHLDHWQEGRDKTYQVYAFPIMRSYFDKKGQNRSNQSIIEQLNGFID